MKKIASMVIIFVFMSGGLFASGMPVIDILGLLQMIESGFTMWDQLEANIAQVEKQYKQLEQTVKAFESYDFNEFGRGGNFREMFRGSLRSTMTYVNKMNNLERDIENILNAKTLKFGNQSMSFTDIITNPATAIKDVAVESVAFVAMDPFNMSQAEKIAFLGRYGLSKENYMRMSMVGEILGDSMRDMKARAQAKREERKKEAEEPNALLGEALETESLLQLSQIEVVQKEKQKQALKDVEDAVLRQAETQGWFFQMIAEERKLAQSSRSGNQINLDRFLSDRLKKLKDNGDFEDRDLSHVNLNKKVTQNYFKAGF